MPYLIQGKKRSVLYCANYRVGSTATGKTIEDMGGERCGHHHEVPYPSEVPKNCLVVETVRHHCDVIVSYWYKKASGWEFEEFVNLVLSGEHPTLRSDGFYKRYSHLTNYIMRYETLQFEFDVLCINAGLPLTKLHVAPTKRPGGLLWKHMYTPSLLSKVCEHYKDEMESFGYGRS